MKYELNNDELFVVTSKNDKKYFTKMTHVCYALGINSDVLFRLFTDDDYASRRGIRITIENCPDVPYKQIYKPGK